MSISWLCIDASLVVRLVTDPGSQANRVVRAVQPALA